MDQIKGLLILYAAILVFNVIFSAILWKQTSDKLYRLQCFAWIGSSLALFLDGLAADQSYLWRALAFSSLFLESSIFALLLSRIVGLPYRWKRFLAIQVAGMLATFLLSHWSVGPNLMSFPVIFSAVLPMLDAGGKVLFSRRRDLSIILRLFAAAAFFSALHGLDYAYAIDKPEFMFAGFTLALVGVFALSIFSTAAVLEKVAIEHSRIQIELKYQAMLVNSAKLASLGEMAAGIAHQINTPLAIIQMQADQLADQFNGAPGVQKISDTVDRIAAIVSSLRSFARDTSHDTFISESIASIVSEALLFCEERFSKNQIKLIKGSFPDVKVLCQPVGISQVLFNLLNNAFDAVVDLPGERWIKLEITEFAGFIKLAITDSGPGIAPALREKIFQPFFTTKGVGRGAGLGLSISAGIVAAQHGTLTLDPRQPHTCFVLMLPKATG